MFANVIKFLAGKKTYLVSAGALLYAIGIHQGWWPHQPDVDLAFGGAGAITIRAAITKLCQQVQTDLNTTQPTAAVTAVSTPTKTS